jgi:hypothetical protein
MKSLLVCLSLLLFSAAAFTQGNQGTNSVPINPPADDRTGIEGYPTTRPGMLSPSLKRLSGDETKLWQARTTGKTNFIKRLMTESATIVSTTGAKNRKQWIEAIETGACTLKSYKLTDFVVKNTSPTDASISRSGTSIHYPRALISLSSRAGWRLQWHASSPDRECCLNIRLSGRRLADRRLQGDGRGAGSARNRASLIASNGMR